MFVHSLFKDAGADLEFFSYVRKGSSGINSLSNKRRIFQSLEYLLGGLMVIKSGSDDRI